VWPFSPSALSYENVQGKIGEKIKVEKLEMSAGDNAVCKML
jgi:hypothetical protein